MRENMAGSALSSPVLADARLHVSAARGATVPPSARSLRMRTAMRHVLEMVLAPLPAVASFDEWWKQVSESVSGIAQKGLNSLIILGAWTIWRHRKVCVFNEKSPPSSNSIGYGGGGHL
jgi:hypothetical protein